MISAIKTISLTSIISFASVAIAHCEIISYDSTKTLSEASGKKLTEALVANGVKSNVLLSKLKTQFDLRMNDFEHRRWRNEIVSIIADTPKYSNSYVIDYKGVATLVDYDFDNQVYDVCFPHLVSAYPRAFRATGFIKDIVGFGVVYSGSGTSPGKVGCDFYHNWPRRDHSFSGASILQAVPMNEIQAEQLLAQSYLNSSIFPVVDLSFRCAIVPNQGGDLTAGCATTEATLSSGSININVPGTFSDSAISNFRAQNMAARKSEVDEANRKPVLQAERRADITNFFASDPVFGMLLNDREPHYFSDFFRLNSCIPVKLDHKREIDAERMDFECDATFAQDFRIGDLMPKKGDVRRLQFYIETAADKDFFTTLGIGILGIKNSRNVAEVPGEWSTTNSFLRFMEFQDGRFVSRNCSGMFCARKTFGLTLEEATLYLDQSGKSIRDVGPSNKGISIHYAGRPTDSAYTLVEDAWLEIDWPRGVCPQWNFDRNNNKIEWAESIKKGRLLVRSTNGALSGNFAYVSVGATGPWGKVCK